MDFFLIFAINVIRIIKFAIIARILISFAVAFGGAHISRSNRLILALHQVTEPILGFFRRLLPNFGMIDLSPLIAFIALDFLQIALIGALVDL